MNAWQSFLATVLAQVTVITFGAAIAMTVARRSAALRHALGVVALAFVLASPVLAALLPRSPWLGGGAQSDASQEAAPLVRYRFQPEYRPETVVPAGHQPLEGADTADAFVTPRSEPEDPPTPTVAAGLNAPRGNGTPSSGAGDDVWLLKVFALAFWIWAAGVAIFCLRSLSVRRQLRALARSVQTGSMEGAAAAAARRAVGLKALPPVGISDLAPMPLVLGSWRPIVVLPRRLVETGSAARLRDVLIHEFAHILRHDPATNAAQHVARIVFWPHPGVHWLNRQIAEAREEVCDNFVLHGANPSDYSQTLLELAEQCGGGRVALSLLGMFSHRYSLEKRVAAILNPRRVTATCANRKPLAIATLLLAAICTLVGGVGALAEDSRESTVAPAAASKAETPAREMKRVTIHGTCQDQESKPVPRPWVRVFRCSYDDEPSCTLLGEVRCEEDGRFSIPDVEIDAHPDRTKETTHFQVVATADGYASASKMIDPAAAAAELSLEMASNPGTLSGVVTDEQGRPIKGVTVFLPCCGTECVPDFMSAVTDDQGRYAIGDLKRWKREERKQTDPKTGTPYFLVSACFVSLRHPDYAPARGKYSGIPQQVNARLVPPAIIEGQVVDQVTGQPLANVTVRAQGIARSEAHRTRTDMAGQYRLRTNKEHFNIWAEADDRIAIAAKAVAAEPGKTLKDVNVRMVRGGFVVGTVLDGATGKPVAPTAEKPIRVAHYGPARPRTGAAVTSTAVNPDGTYRLRVAPGRNYAYLMSGGTSEYVDVVDGGETKLDLTTGEHRTNRAVYDDPDFILREKMARAAREEEKEADRQASGAPAPPKPAARVRPDTPTGRLLDKLEEQNAGSARFQDTWLRTLKAIVDQGPEAVPEVIAELDATTNDMMLRCCGFTLRAIGDKRAVPALIRAVPKTLLPAGSDMGLRSDDDELAKWAQERDLDRGSDGGKQYSFGRPVREIFGALNKLTGQKMSEKELYHMSLDGVASQRRMKRELFYREAKKWADWWDEHAAEHTQDAASAHANLPELVAEPAEAPAADTHYKTSGNSSGWILQSVLEPKSRQTFYDLDTGRVAALPEKWRKAGNIAPLMDEVLAWAFREGFDLVGTEYAAPDGQRYYALRAIAMQAWELDAKRWKMKSDDITVEELQAEGTPASGLLLHFNNATQAFDPKATASFLYVTRSGTPGLLFVGIEVRDDSLKPGGIAMGDSELEPVAFYKGRRFGFTGFEEVQ
ncbi:MAG: carboxypeptidase regulatory-like domain-containing protein [Planctomycetia bacterium]|nr:carboxypeptidase regulatory-like domain-containing protein [Planctomycetia bacterium]